MIRSRTMTTELPESTPTYPAASDRPARRIIRSFVVRGGRITAGQERALTELWPEYGLDYTGRIFDFDVVFGRTGPRLLEIGFGTGEALLKSAIEHPDLDCVGIEVHRAGIGHLLLGAHAAQLSNVRVIAHDAVEVLTHAIAAGSFAAVHVFFPDPWPKKRHHKRRLLQPPFIAQLARVLAPAGTLRIATDWQPYAEQIFAALEACASLRNTALHGHYADRAPERPLTRFERRGERLGHKVYDFCYSRRS